MAGLARIGLRFLHLFYYAFGLQTLDLSGSYPVFRARTLVNVYAVPIMATYLYYSYDHFRRLLEVEHSIRIGMIEIVYHVIRFTEMAVMIASLLETNLRSSMVTKGVGRLLNADTLLGPSGDSSRVLSLHVIYLIYMAVLVSINYHYNYTLTVVDVFRLNQVNLLVLLFASEMTEILKRLRCLNVRLGGERIPRCDRLTEWRLLSRQRGREDGTPASSLEAYIILQDSFCAFTARYDISLLLLIVSVVASVTFNMISIYRMYYSLTDAVMIFVSYCLNPLLQILLPAICCEGLLSETRWTLQMVSELPTLLTDPSLELTLIKFRKFIGRRNYRLRVRNYLDLDLSLFGLTVVTVVAYMIFCLQIMVIYDDYLFNQ